MREITLSTRVDAETMQRIERFCGAEERSAAWLLRKALLEYLTQWEGRQ